MHADLRAQEAFRRTGLRPDAGIPRGLRPALTARLRDLDALRYDFPVVLLAGAAAVEVAAPLTTLVDRLVESLSIAGTDGARLRSDILGVERRVREAVGGGASATVAQLWDAARQGSADVPPLGVDGEALGCDARFADRLVAHAWRAEVARKSARLREELERLLFGLRRLVAADAAWSAHGVSAERLQETFASGDPESFDFDVMSRLLTRSAPPAPLPARRRQRIAALIASLDAGRPFTGQDPEAYTFDRCGAALRAFRSRHDGIRAFLRAMTMARLEVEGKYDEALHGLIFRQLAEAPLSADDLAALPSYLVSLCWDDLGAAERADVEELLCSGMPVKILVRTDDLLAEAAARAGMGAIGAHAHALAGAALGLDDVFVMQAPASHLPRMREQLARGLAYAGPALFSVYSGARGGASLPPYLSAAAALESRVFPALVYDPETGRPLSLALNPQPEAEWPVYELEYEDHELQRATRKVAFTPADFMAADERFAAHFLPLDAAPSEDPAAGATVLMVDAQDRLRELVVDEQVAFQARRCAHRWKHLRNLAAQAPRVEGAVPPAPAAEAAPPPPPAVAAAPQPASEAPAVKPASGDEAYIETPRCTTCNECTQLNNRMFAYDANQQAYIADIDAGTYRELVEAAESCQVSIIHPGKPRNPAEPDLEELLERAAPFR